MAAVVIVAVSLRGTDVALEGGRKKNRHGGGVRARRTERATDRARRTVGVAEGEGREPRGDERARGSSSGGDDRPVSAPEAMNSTGAPFVRASGD